MRRASRSAGNPTGRHRTGGSCPRPPAFGTPGWLGKARRPPGAMWAPSRLEVLRIGTMLLAGAVNCHYQARPLVIGQLSTKRLCKTKYSRRFSSVALELLTLIGL